MSITRTYYCASQGIVRRLDALTLPWTSINTPTAVSLYDIKADPADSDKVFTAGSANTIYYSTDAGVTWLGAGGSYGSVFLQTTWYELWPIDSSNIVICGDGGFVAKSSDGGVTFNNLTLFPTPSGVIEPGKVARAIHFPTTAIGSVGFEDKVFKTIDGGTTWIACNSGLGLVSTTPNVIFQINGIYTDPTGQTIVVHGNTDIYRSIDGGISFLNVYQYGHSGNGTHLTWTDSNHFWGTGNYGEMTQSTNGGTTWNLIRTGYPTYSNNLAAHFYSLIDGFFSSDYSIYSTNTAGVTGTYSDTTSNPDIPVKAIWTAIPASCHMLVNCGGKSIPIVVTDDLSQYVNQVVVINSICYFVLPSPNCLGSITLYPQGVPSLTTYSSCEICNAPSCYYLSLCGDTGSPPQALITSDDLSAYIGMTVKLCDPDTETCSCYQVSSIPPCIVGQPLPFPITLAYPDCDCCNPPEVEPEISTFQPSIPEINKHLYQITDSQCDIDVNKKYANAMYTLFKYEAYGIGDCCGIDQDKILIKKQLSDLSLKLFKNVCS